MKRLSILQLLVIAGLISTCAAQACGNFFSPWVEKTSCPSNHREGAAQVVGNKLYIFAGFYTNDLFATNRLDIYEPATDKWSVGTPVPAVGNVTHCQSAVWRRSNLDPAPEGVGRYVYIASGFLGKNPGEIYNQVWRYDVQTDNWTRMPDLPENRASGAVAIDSEDRLHYVSGLLNRTLDSDKHWTLNLRDISEGWVESTPIPIARNHFPALPFGDYLYLPGGVIGHDAEPLVDQVVFHRFNVKNKTWTQMVDLPFPRSHAEASTMFINNRLVQFGGRNKNPGYPGIMGTAAEFDLQTNTWQYLRSLPFVSTTPTVGFFPNITIGGERADYLVVTVGGIDWNIGRRNTYISKVTWNCTTPVPPGPVYGPEAVDSSDSNSGSSSDSAAASNSDSSVTDNSSNGNNNTDSATSTDVDSSSDSSIDSSAAESSDSTPVDSSSDQATPSNEEEGSASIAMVSLYCVFGLVAFALTL